MAVGVIGEAKPRYFSIVRWGGAELTLAQVKRKLRVEKWVLWLALTVGDLVFPRYRSLYGADQGRLKFDFKRYKRSINNGESGFAES